MFVVKAHVEPHTVVGQIVAQPVGCPPLDIFSEVGRAQADCLGHQRHRHIVGRIAQQRGGVTTLLGNIDKSTHNQRCEQLQPNATKD